MKLLHQLAILLTGDIEAVTESMLIKNTTNLDVDILVAPHHGSKTSSTRSFISAVSPEYVLFSVGYLNRYGHPAKDVVELYRQEHVKMLNTASDGAIHFDFGMSLSKPDRYRKDHGHFWNRNHVE